MRVRPQRKEFTFTTPNTVEEHSPEERISQILWRWHFAAPPDRTGIISDSQLALLLEYWFPFEEIPLTRSLGTWCDGVVCITVHNINRTAFGIVGIGYFPHDFMPFELEFHYRNRRDLLTSKILFRFGMMDQSGCLQTIPSSRSPEQILSRRPRDIQDWAVVVELLPIEPNER